MSTKTSACIRLIISLIAVVLLVFLLIMGISGRNLFGFNFNFRTKYPNADKYSSGNAKFSADELKKISIDWIDGEVNVLPCEGSNIEIEETADGNLEEKQKVHYYYNNGDLYIQYEKSQKGFIFPFTANHNRNKSLTLRIPETLCNNLSEFKLDTASSQNNISGLSCSDMDIDSVSGETVLKDVEITNELKLDNVSGDIDIQGGYEKLNIDNVSGNCTIDTYISPSSFNFDTVSGHCELMLPYSSEFCAKIDRVSGKINFNGFQTTKDGDKYICGNSENVFDFDTVSGDITITRIDDDSSQSDNNDYTNDNQDDGDSQSSNEIDDNNTSQNSNESGDNGIQDSGNSQNGNGSYRHGYNYKHHDESH